MQVCTAEKIITKVGRWHMAESQKEPRKGVHMTQVWRERVGENIRLLREQRGWTQLDLLQRLRDLSGDPEFYKDKGSISLIEKGLSAPSWDKMLQITRLFQTTLEVLAGLEHGAPKPTHYTTTVQGNAYNESVILGNQDASRVVDQVLERLKSQGLVMVCPTCHAKEEPPPP